MDIGRHGSCSSSSVPHLARTLPAFPLAILQKPLHHRTLSGRRGTRPPRVSFCGPDDLPIDTSVIKAFARIFICRGGRRAAPKDRTFTRATHVLVWGNFLGQNRRQLFAEPSCNVSTPLHTRNHLHLHPNVCRPLPMRKRGVHYGRCRALPRA